MEYGLCQILVNRNHEYDVEFLMDRFEQAIGSGDRLAEFIKQF